MSKTNFTIGRDPSADIPIADNSVSRIHADAAVLEGDRLFLTDRQSSNGTFLLRDGRETRISQEKVGLADTVKFGSVTMPVRDLLTAIRRKSPPPLPPKPAAAPRPEAIRPNAFRESTQLVRCSCGTVKALGSACPACGA